MKDPARMPIHADDRIAAVPRGQRGSRERGERTKARIVEAVVQVIARDGVRGVTHRAVAREAGVNLSLTTYYFVDRYDLVASAFAAFVGYGTEELEQHWARAFRHVRRLIERDRSRTGRERVREYVTDQVVGYVHRKIVEAPLGLAVEQHIFSEAMLDARLTELAGQHRRQLLAPLVQLCELFDSDDAQLDADLLFGTILRLEYESLLVPADQVDSRRIRASIRRVLGWILKLP
jgi:DNA-binding transcriptional regulator YbjK